MENGGWRDCVIGDLDLISGSLKGSQNPLRSNPLSTEMEVSPQNCHMLSQNNR